MTFRVLIIDDDEKLNQLLTDYLGKMGFTIAFMKAFLGMLSVREQLLLDVIHELRSTMKRMKAALDFILKNSSSKVYSSMCRKWSRW